MNTLQEYYVKQKLIKKINNIEVITEELDQLLAEGVSEEELSQMRQWLNNVAEISKSFTLPSMISATQEAQEVLADASGMMGNWAKLKSKGPFVDGIGQVSSFASATLKFFNGLEDILTTIAGIANLSDEQKKQPLRLSLNDEMKDKFATAIDKSLVTTGVLSIFGKNPPFLNDTRIKGLTAELLESPYENLVSLTPPTQIPLEKEDIEDIVGAEKSGNIEDIEDAIDTPNEDETSAKGDDAGNESDADMSPSDEVDKISNSSTSPKAAIADALNSWAKSSTTIEKALSDNPDIIDDIKSGLDSAIDSASDDMAKKIEDSIDTWVRKNAGKLVDNGVATDSLYDLVDIGAEVAELIKKQKVESTKYTITLSQIESIVNKRLDKKYFNIL